MFRGLDGVVDTSVGYSGGTSEHPTYEQVCGGHTGHTEVVEVVYDPARLSLDDLLAVFWEQHDPTYATKAQYRSAIFTTTPAQQHIAEASKAAREAAGERIVTLIAPARPYWRAEEYHQRYLSKKPWWGGLRR